MSRCCKAFSLTELLTVIAIIAVLTAVLLPVLGKAREAARQVIGAMNQRQVVIGAQEYATEGNDRYPESVATVGLRSTFWNWQEPGMMTGLQKRTPTTHRSMSAYLYSYLESSGTMYCNNAPDIYPFLDEVWEAGESWDHPETGPAQDPFSGTLCFYWNYVGYLPAADETFQGPQRIDGRRNQSTLMVSEYFGYDHWRSPGAFGSCEKFDDAAITAGSPVSSSYWSTIDLDKNLDEIDLELQAGYTDGHVESYQAADTVEMKVSLTADGMSPYPPGAGPGIFFLPRGAE